MGLQDSDYLHQLASRPNGMAFGAGDQFVTVLYGGSNGKCGGRIIEF